MAGATSKASTKVGVAVAAAALGGALSVATMPSAVAKPDPCAASSVAKTVSSVSDKTSEYLEKNPETDRVLSQALKEQAGPQTLMGLKSYFDANPKVGNDLREISAPLTDLTTKCELPISLPQMLGLLQNVQNQGGLPGQLPGQLPNPADVLGETGRLPGPAGVVSNTGERPAAVDTTSH